MTASIYNALSVDPLIPERVADPWVKDRSLVWSDSQVGMYAFNHPLTPNEVHDKGCMEIWFAASCGTPMITVRFDRLLRPDYAEAVLGGVVNALKECSVGK